MATLDELNAEMARLKTAVAQQGPTLGQIGDGIAEARKDIADLKTLVGEGKPGITPEEADGVLVTLTEVGDAMDTANAALKTAADALTQLGTEQ